MLAITLALGFLGSRGIWDPDEGRYTNVALNMLDSGDWLNPRRNDEIGHWTKPPLTYWAIAASVAVFGSNPWAARLPAALAYLLCVWFAWRIARRLAPGSEDTAAVIYATMLFTVGAAQLITTDYVLAACVSLAMWAFVEARFPARAAVKPAGGGDVAGQSAAVVPAYAEPATTQHGPADLDPRLWLALMWVGFALAFIAKGPAALLPLPAILLYDWLMPGRSHRALQWSGIVVFLLLALPWYVAVTLGNPGLFEYFIGDEVVNRVTTNEFGRHGEWYGWIQIYLPTLLIGTLPWTPALLRWARALPASVRGWRTREGRTGDAAGLLLTLWLLLPLLVFCVSRSRLPLYILPLFVPLAVLAARQRLGEGKPLPRWRWLLLWSAGMLALQLATAHWPTHKNAEAWAQAIRARAPGPITQLAFVDDMARYGLHLHLGVEVEKLSLQPEGHAQFNPEYDETVADEINTDFDPASLWITKQAHWPAVREALIAQGIEAIPQGTPYEDRILFRIRRMPH